MHNIFQGANNLTQNEKIEYNFCNPSKFHTKLPLIEIIQITKDKLIYFLF